MAWLLKSATSSGALFATSDLDVFLSMYDSFINWRKGTVFVTHSHRPHCSSKMTTVYVRRRSFRCLLSRQREKRRFTMSLKSWTRASFRKSPSVSHLQSASTLRPSVVTNAIFFGAAFVPSTVTQSSTFAILGADVGNDGHGTSLPSQPSSSSFPSTAWSVAVAAVESFRSVPRQWRRRSAWGSSGVSAERVGTTNAAFPTGVILNCFLLSSTFCVYFRPADSTPTVNLSLAREMRSLKNVFAASRLCTCCLAPLFRFRIVIAVLRTFVPMACLAVLVEWRRPLIAYRACWGCTSVTLDRSCRTPSRISRCGWPARDKICCTAP
mmetsp:Transcript_7277/g.22189  ORF Transcript_7277/g.22189 Transcript_7277/m.22189 type:complete len:324 (-) Transcript_7277:515-1486(-)